MTDTVAFHDMAVVAIGRNEGERLRRCLESVVGKAAQVVYVDSGSTDDSVAMARGMGVDVVELDMSIPFTAARARNEGFARAKALSPALTHVQFVDGDCEIVAGWLEQARDFLRGHPDVAVVCGRRRERYPERSIYNALCDIEWDTPVGEAKACGGDALMRVDAFEAVGGFRPGMIAGEEPELCVRLGKANWKIWRIGAEMTLHDAAMTRFGQWWKRAKRAGHAFAEGAWLHGASPIRHKVAETRRALVWGGVVPVLVLGAALVVHPSAWLLLGVYPLRIVRLAARREQAGNLAWWRALFLVLGNFPEALGVLKFEWDRRMGQQSRLIEYK